MSHHSWITPFIQVIVITELGASLRHHYYLGTRSRKVSKSETKSRKKITKLKLGKIMSNPLEDRVYK